MVPVHLRWQDRWAFEGFKIVQWWISMLSLAKKNIQTCLSQSQLVNKSPINVKSLDVANGLSSYSKRIATT